MLNTKEHNCTDGTKRRSTGAMIAGIVLLGSSGIAALGGAASHIVADDYHCDYGYCPSPDEGEYRVIGTALLIGAGAMLAAGLPLTIYGAPKVLDEEAVAARPAWQPELRWTLTGGSLGWHF